MKILWRIWGALCLWTIVLFLGYEVFLKINNENIPRSIAVIIWVGFMLLYLIGTVITLYKIYRTVPKGTSIAPEGYKFKTAVIIGLTIYNLVWSGWLYDTLRAFLQPLKSQVIIHLVLVTVPLALLGLLLVLGTKYLPAYFVEEKNNADVREGT